MSDLNENTLNLFGNKLRIRTCGLLIRDEKILMIRHRSLGTDNTFWSPPGGGMEFGEQASQALVREFEEETGLTPVRYEFGFVHEFLNPPLHALELFFIIQETSGELILGKDPEMVQNQQLIEEVRFMDINEIKDIPSTQKHHLLNNISSWEELLNKRGYSLFRP